MKTPDETKRALVTCTELVMPKEVQHRAMLDALDLIQKLEAKVGLVEQYRWERDVAIDQLKQLGIGFGEKVDGNGNAELLTRCEQLEEKCHQLERERDAAVADIPRACGRCKWYGVNHNGCLPECKNPNGCRNISGVNTGFEWRGVKEE